MANCCFTFALSVLDGVRIWPGCRALSKSIVGKRAEEHPSRTSLVESTGKALIWQDLVAEAGRVDALAAPGLRPIAGELSRGYALWIAQPDTMFFAV